MDPTPTDTRPTVAIDIDGTWTKSPGAWSRFATAYREAFNIIIVTGRIEPINSDEWQRLRLPGWINVFYSAGVPKKEYMQRCGIYVDIWIDDDPGLIDPKRAIRDDIKDEPTLVDLGCIKLIKIKQVQPWSGVIRACAGIEHDVTTSPQFVAESRPEPGDWLVITPLGMSVQKHIEAK